MLINRNDLEFLSTVRNSAVDVSISHCQAMKIN